MDQDYEFHPKHAHLSTEGGYRVPSNLYKIGKACDEWLARRHALEGRRPAICQWKKATEYRPPEPERDAERKIKQLAREIRRHVPESKAQKAKRKSSRRQKKYATEAERKAAMAANTAAYWASMDPVKKAERLEAMRQRKIKHAVPRHKRPGWLEYKREWERKRRKTHPLTQEQLEHRRAQARKNDRARRARRKAEAAAQAA